MSGITAAAPRSAVVVRRRRVARPGGHFRLISALCGAVCAVWLLRFASADERAVFTPIALVAAIAIVFVGQLYARDGVFPLFEVGTMFTAAAVVYTVVPLLNFAAGGMSWSITSDFRLRDYASSAAEVGAFAYRHVVFLACFAAAYLLVRRRARPVGGPIPRADAATTLSVVVLVIACTAYLFFLESAAGTTSNPYAGGTGLEWQERLPLFVLQITNIILMMAVTLQLVLAVILVTRWKSWPHRLALFVWVTLDIVLTVWTLGSRTVLVRLLLVIALMYHRFVKPLTFKMAAVGGAIVLAGFLLHGAAREFGGLQGLRQPSATPLLVNNEFQVLFANAYDLHEKKRDGVLQVPWQIYVSDFYLLIPSQFLPFRKIDPSEWYGDTLGLTGTGVGVMFGAIAQGVVGGDWVELAARGALLGICFAWLHRFYVKRSGSFWITVLYVCVCAWSYYSFRASTFYLVYFVVYYLGSAYVAVNVLRLLLARVQRSVRRSRASGEALV